jgi:hypothetical protein
MFVGREATMRDTSLDTEFTLTKKEVTKNGSKAIYLKAKVICRFMRYYLKQSDELSLYIAWGLSVATLFFIAPYYITLIVFAAPLIFFMFVFPSYKQIKKKYCLWKTQIL